MRAVATRVERARGARIQLWTSPRLRALNESIPGAYWSARDGVWSLPCSMDFCRALRSEFGAALEIRPALRDWAREVVAHERSQAALGSTLEAVPLTRVPARSPALAKRLESRPYQTSAARFIADGRFVLLADTPGLGKTTEAIAGVVEAGTPGPYLVIAPQTSLETVWERELQEVLPDDYVATVGIDRYNRAKRGRMLDEALDPSWDLSETWVIINKEMVRTRTLWICKVCGDEWAASDLPRSNVIDCGHDPMRDINVVQQHEYPQLFDRDWGAIIIDESQQVLIRKSGKPTLTRNGARLLRVRERDGLRLSLSGTPMRGKPHLLWGTLNWLLPRVYTGFWSWAGLNYDMLIGYGGSRSIVGIKAERRDSLYKSLGAVMIRRTKAEVSPELPPKQYCGTLLDSNDPDSPRAVWLEMSKQQAKAYQQMQRDGAAYVESGQVDAVGGLAELTRLKQFATAYGRMDGMEFRPELPSNKFDWLVQFLEERNIIDHDPEEPTGKVVVVSQFTKVLELFQANIGAMGVRTLAITGRVTGANRKQAQDLFNDPNSGFHVMFLNTAAGGVSITLDAADDMVLLDETHVPDDQEQAEDRINNRRPEERVAQRNYWYLKSLGTVEESIAAINAGMEREQKEVLDGRRGVTYVRAVFDYMKEGKDGTIDGA